MRRTTSILTILVAGTLLAGSLPATETYDVSHHPDPSASLRKRWDWAEDQTSQGKYLKGYWIGYSIEKLMHRNSFTGCWSDDWRDRISLSEILYGEKVEDPDAGLSKAEAIKKAVRDALDEIAGRDEPEEKVLKEVALLFQYTGRHALKEMRFSNVSLHVDLESLPVLWLGKAEHSESIGLLTRRYKSATNLDTKEHMISAVGMHPPNKDAFEFLKAQPQ